MADAVRLSFPHRTADVSRDLLDVVPLPGSYQWVAEDVALLMVATGLDAWPPIASDSLATAIAALEEGEEPAPAAKRKNGRKKEPADA